MSWILSGEHRVHFDLTAKALEKLLDQVNSTLRGESAGYEEVIERIASGTELDLNKPVDLATQRLAKEFLRAENAIDINFISRLRRRLWTIEEQPEIQNRIFGWPALKMELAKETKLLAFSLNAEGGISFEVQKGTIKDDVSKTKLVLLGKINPKFSTSVNIPNGIVNAGGSAELKRSLTYIGAYDDDVRTGRAIVDALSRANSNLSDFHSVLNAFNHPSPHPANDEDGLIPAPLDEIIFSGRQSLGANLAGTVNVPLKAAEISADIKTAIEIGSEFNIKIRRKNKNTLILEAVGGRTNDKTLELSLGASVSLSAITPEFALSALKRVKNVEPLFDKIDAILDPAETWLKPGSAIKSELIKRINTEISGNGKGAEAFKTFLKDIFGVGSGTSSEDLVKAGAQLLADFIDDNLTLFTLDDQDEGAFAEILNNLSESLISQIAKDTDAVETRFKKILSGAQSHLSEKLDDGVNKIDDSAKKALNRILGYDPVDLLSSLREALGNARAMLAKTAKALSDNSLDALSVEIAWARSTQDRHEFSLLADISVEGADFYAQSIKKTSAAINRIIESNNDIPGVWADPEKSWLLENFSHQNSLKWNISILGASAKTSRSAIHKLAVQKSLGGVGIFTAGAQSVENSFFSKEAKKFSFANVLTFGPVEKASPRIGIELTHDDNNLHVKEAEEVMSVFAESGLISPDTFEQVRASITYLRARATGKKFPAELNIALGLPGRQVIELIKYAHNHSEKIEEIAAHALASTQASRDEIEKNVQVLLKVDSKLFTDILGINPNAVHDIFKSEEHYLELVKHADKIFKAARKKYNDSLIKTEFLKIKSFWKNLDDARMGLQQAFFSMHKAQQLMEDYATKQSPSDEDDKNALKELINHQKNITKNLEHWLKPGFGGFWDRPPERAAELFIALQALSVAASIGRPALIVSIDPDDGAKKLFIGDPS